MGLDTRIVILLDSSSDKCTVNLLLSLHKNYTFVHPQQFLLVYLLMESSKKS